MAPYALTLYEERLAPSAGTELPPTPRVLYVSAGELEVSNDAGRARLVAGSAWHGTMRCSMAAGARGATVLRYELRHGEVPPPGAGARILLDHPIALDPSRLYLMRCDRVEFDPGGEALPHGHRGGGIRCLLEGALEVRVGGQPGRLMKPGDAWFESGVEPVHAIASRETPTVFIRVSILPREIRGRSSIVYVDPAHASVKPRQYTVFVDEPIDLHGGPDMAPAFLSIDRDGGPRHGPPIPPEALGAPRQSRGAPRNTAPAREESL